MKATEHFEKAIFPYVDQIKENMTHQKQKMSLMIMDNFKGQDNDDLRDLCTKINWEIVIIPQNLANKFQQLDLTQPAFTCSMLT